MKIHERSVLTNGDQQAIALLLVVFLVVMGCYLSLQSAVSGGLVEFDDLQNLSASYEVEINSAPWQEFAVLPGIGNRLAHRIVQYRRRTGGFRGLDQLKQVVGIGDKKFVAIKPFLRLEKETP